MRIEKKEYVVKKNIYSQLEPVIDVLLNLEQSVVEVCEKEGLLPEPVLQWVFEQLPCVEFSCLSSSYILRGVEDEDAMDDDIDDLEDEEEVE